MRKLKFVTWLLIILLSINSIAYAAPSQANRNNIAPTISLNAAPVKKPVDIVILTDYTDTKLSALNNRIDALKAEFSAVNVDPVFHIVSDLKKIGTQNDVLYWYRRYARFTCRSSYHEWWSGWDQKGGVTNQLITKTLLWEQRQGLANTPGSLPNRNPTNVSFTMSDKLYTTGYVDGDPYRNYYYNVYITCSNDVKTSGTIKVDWGNNQSKADHYESYGAMSNESVSIDKNWNREEKIQNITYDIYSLDFSKLNNLSLRPGSDRHMVLISDGEVKNFGAGAGNYFCFGDMTDSFMNYIAENNFELYGVVPDDTKNMTLLPDKVLKVKPLGESTLLYMQNGDVMRLGDPVLAAQLGYGEKMVPQPASDISGNVIQMFESTYYTYLFRDNGLFSRIRKGTNDVVNLLSGVTKVYNVSNNYIYTINSSGHAYRITMYDASVESLGNSFVCDKIVSIDTTNCIYIDINGIPYMRQVYTISGHEYYYFQQARIRDRNTDALSYLGEVKDIVSYTPTGAWRYPVITLVQYKSGTVQQFTGVTSSSTSSGAYNYYYYELQYESSRLINETNVDRIEFTGYSTILYKKDGTVKMLATDFEQRWNEDDDPYWYPTPRNYLVNVPLSNATSNFKSQINIGYFITNGDGTTYLYKPEVPNTTPVIGSNLINLGSGIKEIGEMLYANSWKNLYILFNDGTVRHLKYPANSNTCYGDTILPYKVKNIYSGLKNAYLVLTDGSVIGAGITNYGQLGYKGSALVETFISPIASSLSYDTTKKYMSLFDIFKKIAFSEFFAAGQYTDAFNKIYNSYQNNGDGKIYVLLGEDVEYISHYSDYENDPEYCRRWSISHDPDYYDNGMGLSVYHNPIGFTENPPERLDKVGKYIINLKVRDNPKEDLRFLSDTDEDKNYYKWSLGEQNLTVYVHRRPIAKQGITIEDNGNETYTVKAFDAGSYDPDHTSRSDKGIAVREWRWRDDSDIVWHYEQMDKSDCDPKREYILQLRVQDMEGAWSDYNTIEIANNPPIALFSIDKNPIFDNEMLLVKDQSAAQSFATLTRWHWIIKKYNEDDTLPDTDIQNDQFNTCNDGTGDMEGYDINVKTDYSDTGAGKYRIYLRVRDSNGMWSDEGTDSSYNLSNMYSEDLEVQESFKITDFRVVMIRDFHLEPYYNVNGKYPDKPFFVNSMAIDQTNFMEGGMNLIPGFSGLTKGYRFEFEIDSINFNEADDTIVITPAFYPYISGVPGTRGTQADLYWKDSNKDIHKAGEGSHSSWADITLNNGSRTITGEKKATWRGEYFIPATSWIVPLDTAITGAESSKLNADIIVNFRIRGYSSGEMKYDYNEKQWPIERTEIKYPYEIGDVIRYDHTKSSLEDIDIIINRP